MAQSSQGEHGISDRNFLPPLENVLDIIQNYWT